MTDFWLHLHDFRYAFIAGPLIAATCSLLSVYIVLRRMAMISECVSHAGFGGISLALLAGYFFSQLDTPWGQQVITGVFCVSAALVIGYISRGRKVSEDSAIGIVLVATVALGMLLLAVRYRLPANGHPVPPNLEDLLFGNIAYVSRGDVVVIGVVAALVFGLIGMLYSEFLYVTLDEDMARINGVPVRFIHTLLLIMISVVIVVSVHMVGFLMITALTIIPGATASLISRRFGGVLLGSLLVGTLGMTGSLVLSTNPPFSKYPSGAIIVLCLFLIFGVVWVVRHAFKPRPVAEAGQEKA